MFDDALSPPLVRPAPQGFRRRLRSLLAHLGLATAGVAAFGAGGGLFGALGGWPDLLNHFAPLWLALAVLGGTLCVAALDRPTSRLGLILAALAGLGSALPLAVELTAGRPAGAIAATPAPAGALRMLTYNLWDGNFSTDEAAEVIRRSGADLVALEEPTRFMAASYPSLADLYPYASPCRTGCDVALLSKRPFRRLTIVGDRISGPPKDRTQLALVRAELEGPDGRPVDVVATHLVWPAPPGPQQVQRQRLAAMIDPAARAGLILAGDFNLTPWSFAMRGFDRSLAPLSRRTRGVLTYPAYLVRPFWPPFLAIDQIYAGSDWRTVRVERLARGGSDHYPVLATLVRR